MRFRTGAWLQIPRRWRRQPLFYLTSIAVLAIGLGSALTIFAIVNTLQRRPISPDHAERLAGIYNRDTTRPDSDDSFSYFEVSGYLRRADSLRQGALSGSCEGPFRPAADQR